MEIDRETVYQLALAGGAVGLFISAALYIGSTYGNGNLSQQGGEMLVGLLGLFIVLMLVAGLFLERTEFESETETESESD